jgi:hypothetical protein
VQQQPLSPLSNVEGTEEKGKPTGTQKRDTTTSAQGQQKSLKDYAQDPEVLNLFGLASEKPMVETEGTVENMKSAQQKRDDTILMNQLAMAGSTAANAMLQQDKPDLKFFEDNIKRAEDPIKDIETIVNTEKIDPNSDISQLYRDFAKEHLNMDLPMDASAQTIASLIPEIDKIAARDDRYKELMVRMKEASTARYNKQEEKNEMLNFNRTAKLRQESSSGSIGKIKDFYNTTDKIAKNFQMIAANPGKYADYAEVVLQGMKAIQMDSSVVRESDLKALFGGINKWEQFESDINKWILKSEEDKKAGKNPVLTPTIFNAMNESVQKLAKISADSYRNNTQKIRNTAKKYNLPLDEIFDPEFVDEAPVNESKTSSSTSNSDIRVGKDGSFGVYNPTTKKALKFRSREAAEAYSKTIKGN